MTDDLLTRIRAAREAQRLAEERVSTLRREILARDVPRPWSFSHEGVAHWTRDQPASSDFATVNATWAQVEDKLRDAICGLPFDRSERPLEIRATGRCKDTGESVEIYVHLPQAEPPCIRSEGHEWSALYSDDRNPEGHPGGLRRLEGCPHCDGCKTTIWPQASNPGNAIVTFEAPHHYPEGHVRRHVDRLNRVERGLQ